MALAGFRRSPSATGRDGKPMVAAAMPVLATDRIRYVGEPVAIVIARTLAQAQDAVEKIIVDVEELPSAPDIDRATAEAAASNSSASASTTSRWTGPTATPRPSTPPSRRPRTSSA